MTQLDQSLPAVLRRRAKTLHADGYKPEFVMTLRRAADELQARQLAAHDNAEETLVQLVGEHRRLRRVMTETVGRLLKANKTKNWIKDAALALVGALKAVPAIGEGRTILTIQIAEDDTPESVVARSYEAILGFFAQRGRTDNGNSKPGHEDDEARHDVSDGGEGDEAGRDREAGEGTHAVEVGAGRDVDQHPGAEEAGGGTGSHGEGPGETGQGEAPLTCNGPFEDARSCAVHAADVIGRAITLEDCRAGAEALDRMGSRPVIAGMRTIRPSMRSLDELEAAVAARGRSILGDLTKTLSERCDHKFIGGTTCAKCGWSPGA